eukprot:204070-Rhodomonas_salina.1
MFLPVKEHCYSFGVCMSPTIIHNHTHQYRSMWNQPSKTHSEQSAGTHLRQKFVLSTDITAHLDYVKHILGVLSNTDLARVVAIGAIFERAGLLSMIDKYEMKLLAATQLLDQIKPLWRTYSLTGLCSMVSQAVQAPAGKYTGIPSHLDQLKFSKQELSHCKAMCKPLLHTALTYVAKVHCLEDRARALAVQIGTGLDKDRIFGESNITWVLATPVIMRRECREQAMCAKFKVWKLSYHASLRVWFSPTRTVLAMEQHGLTHCTLDGLHSLAPRLLFVGHSALSAASSRLKQQSQCCTPIVPVPAREESCARMHLWKSL